MKISTKNLDEFRELNEEYEKLRRKDFDGNLLGGFLIGIFIISFWVTLGMANKHYSWKLEEFACFLLLVVYLGSYFLVFLILNYVSNTYKKIFNHFSHKSAKYLRLKELEEYLPTIRPNPRKQIIDYCDKGLPDLIEQIRINSHNKVVYENLLNTLRENDLFIKEVNLNDDYLERTYRNILWKNDIWFDYQLEEKEQAERRRQVLNSLIDLETKRKSSASSSYNPLGLSNTPNIQNKPIEKRQEKPIERSNQTEKISTPKENITENKPKPIIADTPKQQEFEFEQETSNLIEGDVLPKRRKNLTQPIEKVIKASPKFWENLNNKRIEIGKCGELLVMEYERKRIIKEEGKEFLCHLQHSSVTEGDGLGYDVTSYFGGKKVFIEVKTTKGNFDSNLIFTQNEINSMKKLKENYFLYRIYELDTITNKGKIHIFKGRKEIESFFDFTPQTFTLKRKN